MSRVGRRGWGELSNTDTHTLACVRWAVGSCCKLRKLSSLLCDDLEGGVGREASAGAGKSILTADSLCCIAETNNNVEQLYYD